MRLDGGGVVVALDAHGHGDAVARIDHTCVLPRPHEDPRRLRGQPGEVHARGLVGAVLRPHDGVHRKLEVVGLSTKDAFDGGRLVVGEPQGPMDVFRGQHGITVSETAA